MKPFMPLKTYIGLTGLVLLLLPRLVTAQGNFVFNGGFDTDASGWTLINGAYFDTKGGNPAPDVVLEGTTGAASQTINGLNPGITYFVSGDYQRADGGSSIDPSFGVAIDGTFLFETVAPASLSWQSFSFFYTAASPSAVLSLSQINGTLIHYSIDNISMETAPEPNSLWLIGISGIASAAFFRNRRRV